MSISYYVDFFEEAYCPSRKKNLNTMLTFSKRHIAHHEKKSKYNKQILLEFIFDTRKS